MPRLPLKCLPALLFALPALCDGNTAIAQEPQVQLNVAADTSAIQPGKPFHVAVTLTPEPGWHIYWQNPGDSGLPTKVLWNLPPGFSASDLQFPIPRQFTLPGPIIAYGYDHPTTFLATITPPKDLKPGDNAAIKGVASWLCCKEECVPGRKPFEISLPVSQHAVSANELLFKEAQEKMPANHPYPDQLAGIKMSTTKIADGELINVHIGMTTEVSYELFPLSVPGVAVSDINANASGSDIRFKVRVMEGQKLESAELPVLIVQHAYAIDRPTGFYLNIDISGLAAGHP